MKAGSSNRLIVSILIVAALAIAFWMLALGPKREEAEELSSQVGSLKVSLSEAQAKAAEATAAQRAFPADYRQLTVLGQAVPAGDETSSLLVELDHVATTSKVRFESIQLTGAGETSSAEPALAAVPAPAPAPGAPSGAVPASSTVPPTEAAASVLPLGATIGTAGLGVMPYNLTFSGNFFQIANFIKGMDSLVRTGNKVGVDGRLVTLNGFALNADAEREFPHLDATFSVTTYVTPPTQGVTAGATATAPAPVTTPAGASAAATESASAEPSTAASPQTVSAR
jgi:Tfp pilus assembly protein PilO